MKILIIKIAALGDVLASTPFFHLIKDRHPNSIVDHLVLRGFEMPTSNNPFVDQQIIVEKLNILNLIKLYFRLRRNQYDYAFILHRNFIFQILCYLSNIKNIYGFSSNLNIFLKKSKRYMIDVNRTLQEADLINLSDLNLPKPTNLEYYINKIHISSSKILQNLPKSYIACGIGGGNIFSSARSRVWPSSYYIELISRLKIPFILLGHGDSDNFLANQIDAHTSGCAINLIGKTSYDEAAEIMRNAIFYIGNDSSLLYLASAVGATTLGLFGPTSAVSANPIGMKQLSLAGASLCSPCYNPYDGNKGLMYKCDDNICMKSLTVEKVINFIDRSNLLNHH